VISIIARKITRGASLANQIKPYLSKYNNIYIHSWNMSQSVSSIVLVVSSSAIFTAAIFYMSNECAQNNSINILTNRHNRA